MSRAWAKGSTTQWRKTRAAVLAENQRTNHGKCTLRIPKVCTGQANQVHHVLGKEHGDNIKHLVAVCRACNLKVGQPGRGTKPKKVSRW